MLIAAADKRKAVALFDFAGLCCSVGSSAFLHFEVVGNGRLSLCVCGEAIQTAHLSQLFVSSTLPPSQLRSLLSKLLEVDLWCVVAQHNGPADGLQAPWCLHHQYCTPCSPVHRHSRCAQGAAGK